MRINARLDDDVAQQVTYLTTTTGLSVSQVVREAIAIYHAQAKGRSATPSRLLALAGTGDSGRSDIASNYKEHVAAAMAAKHQAFGVPDTRSRRRAR